MHIWYDMRSRRITEILLTAALVASVLKVVLDCNVLNEEEVGPFIIRPGSMFGIHVLDFFSDLLQRLQKVGVRDEIAVVVVPINDADEQIENYRTSLEDFVQILKEQGEYGLWTHV